MSLPGGYNTHYLIYMLCDGHIERKATIEQTVTPAEAIKWIHLQSYESKVQQAMTKRAQSGR